MRQLLNLLPVSSDKPPNAIGFLIVLAVIIFGPSQLNCLAENLSEKVRPNIVLINLDDADREMFRPEILKERFPAINSIAKAGITFTNCHVTNPLCGPSRACLLRGQYAHAIGHRTNNAEGSNTRGFKGDYRSFVRRGFFDDDLGKWMQDAGYRTIFVGKYINFVDADHRLPKGWDDFYRSQGSRYYRTIRFTNRKLAGGSVERLPENVYRTTAEADDVVQLIQKRAKAKQPLFVYFAPFGPHSPGGADGGMIDSSRDQIDWPDISQPTEKDFDEFDIADKPAPYQKLDRISTRIKAKIKREYRDRMLAVRSVDRAIQRVIDALKKAGIYENTFLIITSDNGFSLGQHRICGKGNSFGRSAHVPLIVSGPTTPAGVKANHLLAHIDLAPTILELGGGSPKKYHDGKSFTKLLADPTSCMPEKWRSAILIENWQTRSFLGKTIATTFCQLRKYDSIYTEWADGSREYYDLKNDPLELTNAISKLTPANVELLAAELKSLRHPMERPLVTLDTISLTNSIPGMKKYRVTGVAEDSQGIESVHFIAFRQSTNEFWNGNEWQTGHCQVPTKLKNRGGIQTEWSIDVSNASVTFTAGSDTVGSDTVGENTSPEKATSDVMILPVATSKNGNRSRWQVPTQLSVDHRPPTTRIYRLRHSKNETPRIVGLARDDHKIAHVSVQLQCRESGLYFNGTHWCRSCQCIRRPVDKEYRWTLPVPKLMPGRYIVRARAVDVSGNFAERWEEKQIDFR